MTLVYQNIVSGLTENRIMFQELEHDSVFTAFEANQLNMVNTGEGIKSIALTGKGKIVVLTMRDDERINFSKLKEWIGFKMRFLNEDQLNSLGTEIGGLAPFGYPSDIPCFISFKAKSLLSVDINPGVNNKTIKLDKSAFNKMLDFFSVQEIPQSQTVTE